MKAADKCKQSFPALEKELAYQMQISLFIIVQIFISDCLFQLILRLLKNFRKN